jgi:hypothetical protein
VGNEATEVPGLAELIDRGIVVPATRRGSDVLVEHPPVKRGDEQALVGGMEEQRIERGASEQR